MGFNRTYLFKSVNGQGYFRLRVTSIGAVFLEVSLNQFVSLEHLWAKDVKPNMNELEMNSIKKDYADKYDVMASIIRKCKTIEEQDVYIKDEMEDKGCVLEHVVRN
jgi:hypothetical protein